MKYVLVHQAEDVDLLLTGLEVVVSALGPYLSAEGFPRFAYGDLAQIREMWRPVLDEDMAGIEYTTGATQTTNDPESALWQRVAALVQRGEVGWLSPCMMPQWASRLRGRVLQAAYTDGIWALTIHAAATDRNVRQPSSVG